MSASVSWQFFKFIKVEDFFAGIASWDRVFDVTSDAFDPAAKSLALRLSTSAAGLAEPLLLIQVLSAGTYRIRFNPGKNQPSDYPEGNSRTIVGESAWATAGSSAEFTLDCVSAARDITITTTKDGVQKMRLIVSRQPYGLKVQSFEDGEWVTVMRDSGQASSNDTAPPVRRDSPPAILFRKVNIDGWPGGDWSIVFAREKLPFTKYIGFGEKGSAKLCHNGSQLTYFNFDNMRYEQVYNKGPQEAREPLYDTNPFFMEFAATPGKSSVIGTFIDNTSELCLDLGFTNASRVLLGSVFDDMDVYQMVSTSCAGVFGGLVQLIGTPRLKPRYALGYHQGCYGYENKEDVRKVADDYRRNYFPIDGLHIDVDLQRDYHTFTIDENKFKDPEAMFRYLREKGYKCCTNITPIISNKAHDNGDDYAPYRTAKALGYFVADRRALPHPGQWETHQNFEAGNEKLPGNTNAHINNGEPFEGEVNYGDKRGTSGHYPDLGRKEVRVWWGEQYRYLFEMGLEFVWQDMTTPCLQKERGDMRSLPFDLLVTDDSVRKFAADGTAADSTPAPDYPQAPFATVQNLYSYNLHKATYLGLNHLPIRQGKRNFIIGRGGFGGTQRYAALWTGDNASEWGFYQISIAQVLGLGMSGQPMSGQDIGGFEPHNEEKWADPELYIRWMIAGAFLPWFRNHYIAKGAKEFQEPYRFVEKIGSVPEKDNWLYRGVLPITRYYVQLRYRLLQLFYDAMFENTLTGLPIVRPLFLHDEDDLALFADKIDFLNDEFLVGKDLLVAPVMEPQSAGRGERDIYLPTTSDWYAFTNALTPLGLPQAGGSTLRFYAYIDTDPRHMGYILPMYVRAGAILPVIELEEFVGERRLRGGINPVTLHIYPGETGGYTMYLDDGVSRASAFDKPESLGGDEEAANHYQEVKIEHRFLAAAAGPKVREITIEIGCNGFTPLEDFFFIAVQHDPREAKGTNGPVARVVLEGTPLELIAGDTMEDRSRRLWNSADSRYYYHEDTNISYIKVFYRNSSKRLEITYV